MQQAILTFIQLQSSLGHLSAKPGRRTLILNHLDVALPIVVFLQQGDSTCTRVRPLPLRKLSTNMLIRTNFIHPARMNLIFFIFFKYYFLVHCLRILLSSTFLARLFCKLALLQSSLHFSLLVRTLTDEMVGSIKLIIFIDN